ncbi:DUF429 domain-containing protein [Methylobacterium soli]|uniref:DUF429 domain-containing protein n=1 Tax=Methylobacterium soli TaxID=553447 RepID=UPI0017836A4E|nr:DUF429 domain-containing protein [Methylobacterium soli]GJE44399.1 hypothetical protein AEGHOMDF_3587 [Methylobacterium soli]
MPLPSMVVHCDWSTSASKRWMSVAVLNEGRYWLGRVMPISSPQALLDAVMNAAPGPVLIGFDFPIGLPFQYGEKTGLADFRDCLAALGYGAWSNWFDVVDDVGDLSLHRPFYPQRPGGRSHAQLITALGVSDINQLRRSCEMRTPSRAAACPLFWTLGGNQVGKAALAGWQEFLMPALEKPGTALWPFDGPVASLLERSRLVIAETYPADAYGQVGVVFKAGMSKTRQTDRQTFASKLIGWAQSRNHELDGGLEASIRDGFGDRPVGEDLFDAFLGLCGMLEVVCGHRPEGTPNQPKVGQWEGWIFGQASEPVSEAERPEETALRCGPFAPADHNQTSPAARGASNLL